jgi:hypothetical protein
MKFFDSNKAMKMLIVSLVGLLFAVLSPIAFAQALNPSTPGGIGGFDSYGNQYPIYGKQYFQTGSWSFPGCFAPNSVATISIASPAVITLPNNCIAGQEVFFATTGTLPTGLTAGTTYYVIATGLSVSSFEVSASAGGAAVNTSGSQTGTQTALSGYSNGTTSYTAAITTPPIPPGFTVPVHCSLIWETSNTSGTLKLGLNVSNATSSAAVISTMHYGSGGATLADLYTLVGAGSGYATPTDISATTTATTANTAYRADVDFQLSSVGTPTTATISGLVSSASYVIYLMPGSKCVVGN